MMRVIAVIAMLMVSCTERTPPKEPAAPTAKGSLKAVPTPEPVRPVPDAVP